MTYQGYLDRCPFTTYGGQQTLDNDLDPGPSHARHTAPVTLNECSHATVASIAAMSPSDAAKSIL